MQGRKTCARRQGKQVPEARWGEGWGAGVWVDSVSEAHSTFVGKQLPVLT